MPNDLQRELEHARARAERAENECSRLMVANEHWRARVSQLNRDIEGYLARIEALEAIEREAEVRVLEMVKEKCALGLDSIVIYNMIEAEIVRLRAEREDSK
ncbi:MAG TPA: hypothetical protein VLH56_19055 [Dissulfurispiraceae bacterium]|nr:hypothetical protein [Dissulfurispiraceae bacterium]